MNCTRLKSSDRLFASAFASVVLPTPGTSSINTLPPASNAVSSRSIASGFPRITPARFARSRSICGRRAGAVKSSTRPLSAGGGGAGAATVTGGVYGGTKRFPHYNAADARSRPRPQPRPPCLSHRRRRPRCARRLPCRLPSGSRWESATPAGRRGDGAARTAVDGLRVRLRLNPGDRSAVMHAGDALAIVHELEGQLSVYRPDSEVSRLNDAGSAENVDPGLFDLLVRAKELANLTGGAFTPLAGRAGDAVAGEPGGERDFPTRPAPPRRPSRATPPASPRPGQVRARRWRRGRGSTSAGSARGTRWTGRRITSTRQAVPVVPAARRTEQRAGPGRTPRAWRAGRSAWATRTARRGGWEPCC